MKQKINIHRIRRIIQKSLFCLTVSDYFYNVLLQPSCLINKENKYFLFDLYETSALHVVTGFYFMGIIGYGPVIFSLYMLAIIYEEHCRKDEKTPIFHFSIVLHFFVYWFTKTLGPAVLLTLADLLVFASNQNACLGPDLVFYGQNVYHIIDVSLIIYAIGVFKTGTRILKRFSNMEKMETIDGYSIYYCALIVLLPAVLFFMPFMGLEPLVQGYGLRGEYITQTIKPRGPI